MGDVFVAANETPDLRGWREAEAKNHLGNVQVEVGDQAARRLIRSNEF